MVPRMPEHSAGPPWAGQSYNPIRSICTYTLFSFFQCLTQHLPPTIITLSEIVSVSLALWFGYLVVTLISFNFPINAILLMLTLLSSESQVEDDGGWARQNSISVTLVIQEGAMAQLLGGLWLNVQPKCSDRFEVAGEKVNAKLLSSKHAIFQLMPTSSLSTTCCSLFTATRGSCKREVKWPKPKLPRQLTQAELGSATTTVQSLLSGLETSGEMHDFPAGVGSPVK